MTANAFKITLHMVSSLDGFIARKDNSMSWFETADNYEKGMDVTGQDAAEFLKAIDCYVMGAHTYEMALGLSEAYGWPYGDTPTIVLSHRELKITKPTVEIYTGDLKKLVNERLKPIYKNVWLVGGAKVARDFMRLNLVDDIRQSILPIILGDGLPFFGQMESEYPLHLKNVTGYKSGMVELHYEVLR